MDTYLRQAFQDLFQEDGLAVFACGLGIHKLFGKFVKYYSQPVGSSKKLVFCVNGNDIFDFACYTLLKEGVADSCLPKVCILFRLIPPQ